MAQLLVDSMVFVPEKILHESEGQKRMRVRGKFGNHRKGYPLPIRAFLLNIAGRKYRDLKGNMNLDIERGKPTEIDFLNGALVSEAERIGLDVPVNGRVVEMVKEIEAGDRKMGLENLFEIYRERK